MFRLALALGKHVHEIRQLPQAEVREWRFFDAIWPIGETRADIRACLVANAIRGALGARGVPLKKFLTKLPTPSARRKRDKTPVAFQLAEAMGLKLVPRYG